MINEKKNLVFRLKQQEQKDENYVENKSEKCPL